MSRGDGPPGAVPSFPRYFKLGPFWVGAYKLCLFIGIYTGILVSAAVGLRSGISPIRLGAACLACAAVGLVGARLYHVVVFKDSYPPGRRLREAFNSNRGGWSVLGALFPIVPLSFPLAFAIGLTPGTFWDHVIVAIVTGGIFTRLGCVFNGCCGGREATGALGLRMHDHRGVTKRRIPVQWLEIGWWLLAAVTLIGTWSLPVPPGSHALGGLAWYGIGRFFLEPLREKPDLVLGRVRVNQVFAGLLAAVAGTTLFMRVLSSASPLAS